MKKRILEGEKITRHQYRVFSTIIKNAKADIEVKPTWEWLESRLPALNAKWLESECGMYRGKLNDAKRGKVKLTEAELKRAADVIKSMGKAFK